MTRRVDPEFQFAEADKRQFDWRKCLTVVVIALLVAMGAFVVCKSLTPDLTIGSNSSSVLRVFAGLKDTFTTTTSPKYAPQPSRHPAI